MRDFFIGLFAIVLIIVLICMPVLCWDIMKCHIVAKNAQTDSRYSLIAGCLIKHDNKFIPLKNWRAF